MERLPRRGMRCRGLSRAAHGLIATLSRTRAMEKRSRLLRPLSAVGHPWVRVVDRGAAPEPLDEITLPRDRLSPPRHPELNPRIPDFPLSGAREGAPEKCWDRGEVVAEEPAAAQAKTVPCNRGCFRGGVHLNARCATLVNDPALAEPLPLSALPSTPEKRRVKREPRTPHSASTIILVRSPQTPLRTLEQRLTDPSPRTRLPLCASLTNAVFSLPMTMSPRTESASARSSTSHTAVATSSVAPDSARGDSLRPALLPRAANHSPPIPSLMSLQVVPPPRFEHLLLTRPSGSKRPSARHNIYCWNCGDTTHSWVKCPKPLQVFCRRCGHWGVTIRDCPDCGESWKREWRGRGE